MDSPASDTLMTDNSSPKVWTELRSSTAAKLEPMDNNECQSIPMSTTNDHNNYNTDDQSMADTSSASLDTIIDDNYESTTATERPTIRLQCLESGDGGSSSTPNGVNSYSVMAIVNADRQLQRPYVPSQESRHLHNHKERLRRSRMKCSCDALRALVPGVTDKTDKATVLEHTVAFLLHLAKCPGVKCSDYMPTIPPPMSSRLLDLYPTLMTGEYQYYEPESYDLSTGGATTGPVTANMTIDASQVLEVREENGFKYVTTTDGQQYMIVESEDGTFTATDANQMYEQPMETDQLPAGMASTTAADCTDPLADVKYVAIADSPTIDDCHKCVQQVINLLSDDKENIDPNGLVKVKKRPGRKPKVNRLAANTTAPFKKSRNVNPGDVPSQPRPKGRPRKVKPIE